MAYIGKIPAAAALTSSDIADSIITEAKMADDAISLTELKAGTDGELITWDASGNPVAVAAGSSGQVLTSAGAGAVPSFQASAVGGKVLQVVQGSDTSERSTTSTSITSGTINATITPSASNSKVIVHITGAMRNGIFNIFRGSSDLGGGQGFGQTNGDESISGIHWMDSPGTTSATTYTGYFKTHGSGTAYFGRGGYTVITLMEIGA